MTTRTILVGLLVALSGCAANMQHPTKTLAEQKIDRQSCEATFEGGDIVDCLKARGYVALEIEPFPFDDIQ